MGKPKFTIGQVQFANGSHMTVEELAERMGMKGKQGKRVAEAAKELVKELPESICQEADRLVSGPRQADYAHPAVDFARTARLWAEVFGHTVTPRQVGLCMILLKVSREIHKHKRDNLVDICGYAQTVQMVEDAGMTGRS